MTPFAIAEQIRERLKEHFGEDGAQLIEEMIQALIDTRDWKDPDDR